jgi:hypothetical protein
MSLFYVRHLEINWQTNELIITLFQLLSLESPTDSEIIFDAIGCDAPINHHVVRKMTKV